MVVVGSTGWCQCAATKISDISDGGADGERTVENIMPSMRRVAGFAARHSTSNQMQLARQCWLASPQVDII